jgi:hypothetical protein
VAKQVKSAALLVRFLAHVDKGLIVGRENSSGPAVLDNMRAAVRAILDGDDPDAALRITRGSGAPRDPHTLLLAVAIHNSREKREKWVVIEHEVNNYLAKIGRPPLSSSRIRKLPKENRTDVLAWISRQKFFQFLDEHSRTVR